MPKISTLFRLNKGQAQLDFVDVDTDRDMPLFIDPYVFVHRDDDWSVDCNNSIVSFFETVIEAIRAKDHARGQQLLNHLHEPNETSLGLSAGQPAGRGVGSKQAGDLYQKLQQSRAARTGLLSELSDCELFIPGIGADKISDVTTNIIRKHLIKYTHQQCSLHEIELQDDVPSGDIWNEDRTRWTNQYERLPVVDGRKILLVPKGLVRWTLAFSQNEYYSDFILTFLQAEHLRQDTALVETLKNGRRRVTKQKLKELHPLAKSFLADFSEDHPEVLKRYKKLMGITPSPTDADLDQDFDEKKLAIALRKTLATIPSGERTADKFHSLMVGILEFIFYPHLIYPIKEMPIHGGRKRIDIAYTNNSSGGFFLRRKQERRCGGAQVFVECKNYTHEIANPELDQLSGRFSKTRGRLGFLVGRRFDKRDRFVARCRDTATDGRGFIIALVDEDINRFLTMIEDSARESIDRELERRFREIIN